MRLATGLRLRLGSLTLLALAAISVAPREARAVVDSQQCRGECGATLPERGQNSAVIQACLMRCETRRAALGNAGPTGTTAMPTPATPWTRLSNGSRPELDRLTREARDQAMERRQGNQGFTVMAGTPAATTAAAPTAAAAPATAGRRPDGRPGAPPPPVPVAVAGAAPRPQPGSSFLGSLMAAQAAEPGMAARASAPVVPTGGLHGAIYLAATPSRSYGLAVGMADRAAAHRGAQSGCVGGQGSPCRMAAEFTARCAAVAHALRGAGAVTMTSHPSTFTVIAATTGTGNSRPEAERAALSACSQRGRGVQCQVTEARCVSGA
ncbi:DUF4189 domain-containing protein [Muricoccus radiodurans]|uniref:DUF4189 domain-containing protein n=1 Tax=Muricoccus radiodurans TaxID=2231721 RepID=UPI003CEA5755